MHNAAGMPLLVMLFLLPLELGDFIAFLRLVSSRAALAGDGRDDNDSPAFARCRHFSAEWSLPSMSDATPAPAFSSLEFPRLTPASHIFLAISEPRAAAITAYA